jgi:hypothetical protein
MAETARSTLQRAGEAGKEDLAEADEFLRTHR